MSVGTPPLVNLAHSDPNSAPDDTSPSSEHQATPHNAGPHPLRVKRRSRLPTSEDPSKKQLFYFVDSNSSSREKRAHVMRHHVQEKRKQLKHTHPRSDSDKRVSHPLRYLSWQQQELLLNSDSNKVIEYKQKSDEIASEDISTIPAGTQSSAPASYSISPVTLLDASAKDPFDSLPVACTREDFILMDCWTNRLTYWSGEPRLMKDQVFRAVLNHPLPFQSVVLAYCARWRAHAYGLKWSPDVELHLGRATKGIEQVMKGGTEIDTDSLAMALTGMAIQEERFGSKQHARAYVDQAVQLLRSRSGSNRVAEALLHYVQFMLMPLRPKVPEDGQQWLVTFLRGAEGLMQEHSTDAYLASVPQRRSVFQMDSPLFPLLSSGPRPSHVPHQSRIYIITKNAPTQELTRTAALIYITAALWDFQGFSSKTARFLDHLHMTVKNHELDRYPACESFVWLLMLERYEADLQEPERSWSTSELLKLYKQLRPELQFLFSEILFSLLMLSPPIRGIDIFERELYSSMPEVQEEP
ncbi:hypothetical protein BDV26DRAFT_264627 [Aspergillus bertholletiae]|uniref:Uncharacterized protein n=1 Tax=Aspergillus bertholletiae TaxID=1226010 RepID=A0A5N7B6K9_9EURO|nr:hypothetical protein BDV26DRAFT_264627 [Aspergillus bertholletiae]